MDDRDPVAILEQQNADRLPDLVPVRMGRMLQSPFAFFRGTAALMAHDLSTDARCGTHIVACGDAHISNFGLFASPERRVLFDLNDFDEASLAPWEWDVKRLATSVVVGGRDNGLTEEQCREAAVSAVRGYRRALRRLYTRTALERYYFRVEIDWLEQVATSEAQKLIRTSVKKARKRYVLLLEGPSHEPLFLQAREAPPSVLETYGGIPWAPPAGTAPTARPSTTTGASSAT